VIGASHSNYQSITAKRRPNRQSRRRAAGAAAHNLAVRVAARNTTHVHMRTLTPALVLLAACASAPSRSSLQPQDRRPTREMLKDVDVLVYDLQEVGRRTWTYVSTMALSMQAAANLKIPFVVLDRPNPIGGEIVEGALPIRSSSRSSGCIRFQRGTA
jgi:hypothetical protein